MAVVAPEVLPQSETVTTPDVRERLENLFNEGEDVDLILHNDDSVFFGTVIEALVKVLEFTQDEAYQAMLQVHNNGKGVLVTCKEPEAEEYEKQLEAYGLTISIDR